MKLNKQPDNLYKNKEELLEQRIPIEDLQEGHLYWVRARNFSLAIFDGKKSFYGIREKWGSSFLFPEHDWDIEGSPYGTVIPIKHIGKFSTCLEDEDATFDALYRIEQERCKKS